MTQDGSCNIKMVEPKTKKKTDSVLNVLNRATSFFENQIICRQKTARSVNNLIISEVLNWQWQLKCGGARWPSASRPPWPLLVRRVSQVSLLLAIWYMKFKYISKSNMAHFYYFALKKFDNFPETDT